MLTIQQAQQKPLVKAAGRYGTVIFKKGQIENGKYAVGSQLANIVLGELIGVITDVYTMPNANHLAVVRLNFYSYPFGIEIWGAGCGS